METPVVIRPKTSPTMSLRAIWLHLRVPFSFFLMPVFWFALSQSTQPDWARTWVVFAIIHLLLYPASHAYNSYYDKDEESIGLLASPPPVDRTLWWVAWGLDGLALLLGAWVSWPFVVYLLVYDLMSKAYSYDGIRLKKYPVLSWLVVGTCQGALTYLATYQAINQVAVITLVQSDLLLAAGLCTLNILAIYPITQVYQHAEDGRRGDLTMSRWLGIRGTFWCTGLIFMLATAGFYFFFRGQTPFYGLQLCLLPTTLFFVIWYSRVYRKPHLANYKSAMRMTLLAGVGLNLFFIVYWLMVEKGYLAEKRKPLTDMNLQARSTQKELLDSDAIPFADISQNMLELNRVNHLLGGHRTTLKGFKMLLGNRKSLHVCEIGSGGGDNLLVLLSWCKANSIMVSFTGIDINPHCVAFARTRTFLEPATTWITSDYRKVIFDHPPDIIFSSLFCHHFTNDELVSQLRWMHQTARLGFFINDLHRHPLAYYAIRLLTWLFSRSYLVKNDAPISVARGFVKQEWKQLLSRASIKGYAIQNRWAFRHLIIYQHA